LILTRFIMDPFSLITRKSVATKPNFMSQRPFAGSFQSPPPSPAFIDMWPHSHTSSFPPHTITRVKIQPTPYKLCHHHLKNRKVVQLSPTRLAAFWSLFPFPVFSPTFSVPGFRKVFAAPR
jgi:hypothetical protein